MNQQTQCVRERLLSYDLISRFGQKACELYCQSINALR